MTVFSRVIVNSRDRRAMHVLASLERIHAVVARATNSSESDDGRTIWRLDGQPHSSMQRLYIVSSSEPDFSVFEAEMGVKSGDCASCDYAPFLERLSCGQQWLFRLTANPTKTIPSEGFVTRGKRQPIVKRADQEEWLFKKFRKIGCHMTINRLEQPEVVIRASQEISFRKRNTTVVLTRVTFEGILSIDDPDMLRKAMVEGIGPAKAYGCGLLTLAPLKTHTVGQL